ncbi:MAG: response regulator [Chloroflexota bacterium]
MTKGKILVVDDEALVRQTMHDVLQGDGYQVTAVGTAEGALETAQMEHFDLVLTDIRMPGMSGVDLTRQLGKLSPETVCVLITGYATIQTAREAMQEGAYDYILKPFDKNGLRMSVANALERKRLRDENARLRELIELYGISQAVATGTEQQELQESVLRTAAAGTRSASGAVLLFDKAVKGIIVGAKFGRGEFAVQLANALLQTGVDAFTARIKRGPYLYCSPGLGITQPLSGWVSQWSPQDGPPILGRENGQALMLPVEAEGEVVGVLAVSKPAGGRSFAQGDLNLLTILCAQLAMAVRSRQRFSEMEESCQCSLRTVAELVDGLSPRTRGHMERVARWSRELGKRAGLNDRELEALETGARLHDIGKLGMAQAALGQGAEAVLDWERGDAHPVLGEEVLAAFPFLADARRIVRHHHERPDGRGFPDGLTARDMNASIYVVQVVNFYDNLISACPTLSPGEIVAQLVQGKGTRFDPGIADSFIQWIGDSDGAPLR